MRLRSGEVVRGYTVHGLLGQGGMAEVYAAVRESDGEQVAIKVLHQTREEAARRVLTEARAQQRLGHPHVVAVLDLLELHGGPALVMERVRGPTLRQWLDAARPAPSDAVTVFRGVLAGVAHAHAAGLVHRDIKPSNVLLALNEAGVVPKVADFGLARLAEGEARTTRTGMMMGTPGYMAPEQIRDAKRADSRADVYALGVLLYEMLCGRLPFASLDLITVYEEMMTGSWVDPETLGAPRPLASAIRRALAPEADQRPASASELRAVLDPGATFVLDGAEVHALSWSSDGAALARSLAPDLGSSSVDPSRPALRTPVTGPEGGLVGREDDLAALIGLLEEPGTVVLHGPPGVGKTALGQALCQTEGRRPDRWPGGVWWVAVGTVHAPEVAVAQALGVPEEGDVAAALGGRGPALLVLDDVEPVAGALAAAVARWQPEAPALTVVVLSRVTLALHAEVLPLAPLSVPDGVALLVHRARAARSTAAPADTDRQVLRRLVERLDGLPLAIELAAGRLRMLSPADLLERLERRLDLLRGTGDDGRPASLRGAIDSAWELLSPRERQAAFRLSLARGPLAPASIDALLQGIDDDPLGVVELLMHASWLAPCDAPDGRRFAWLESLRAYVIEQLGDDRPAGERAHAEVMVARGEAALARFDATGDPDAAARLAAELEDLVAVTERLPRTPLGVRAAIVASHFLRVRGHQQRAQELARVAVARREALPDAAGIAHLVLGEALLGADPLAARQAAEIAAQQAQDDPTWIRAQITMSNTLENLGTRAGDLEGAIARARTLGSSVLEGRATLALAARHLQDKRIDEAERSAEEALALLRDAGHRPQQALALSMIGLARIRAGRAHEAESVLRDAASLSRDVGDRRGQAGALGRLSMVLAQTGRRAEAERDLQEALALSRQIGDRTGQGYALLNLGALQGDPARAAELFRQAHVVARKARAGWLETMALRNIGTSELLRGLPDRATPPLREAVDRLGAGHERDVGRVTGWLALARAAAGDRAEAAALLDGLEAEGDDARVLALVQVALRAFADPAHDWSADVAALLGDEAPSWDVGLTRTLVHRLLGQRG